MGRSVSYASGSVAVAYSHIEYGGDDNFEYDMQVERIQEDGQSLWNSFTPCDKWLGREDKAILENRYAYIGISEYCGLVSIWLAPKDEPMAENFCNQIKAKFLKSFSTLNRIGAFSNGEAVFEKIG